MVNLEIQALMPEPGIGLIRLNVPARRNALTGTMARSLVAILSQFDADPGIGALVISGGDQAFCAGADKGILAAAAAGDKEGERDLHSIYEIFATLRKLEPPTVAALCGPAVGAGLNIALACDARIIGSNAYIRSMFAANSIHPAGGHLKMLRELGGSSLAVRMAAFDQPLDASSAVAAGIAVGPYDPPSVESEAVRFAALAAVEPRLGREIKRSASAVAALDPERAAELEAKAQTASLRRKASHPDSTI